MYEVDSSVCVYCFFLARDGVLDRNRVVRVAARDVDHLAGAQHLSEHTQTGSGLSGFPLTA